MHLAELLTLGARPGAGLLLSLTERCPLSCAHCSTSSAMDSPESSAIPFYRLVAGFRPGDRPDALLMSGGEPFLRPELVAALATAARAAGTRSAALSGMFFARAAGTVPPAVLRAAGRLDHFAASTDRHHEREVPRDRLFAALTVLLDHVPAASLHITADRAPGGGPDPYTEDLVAAVRRRFGTRLPMLVGPVAPTGRARAGGSGGSGSGADGPGNGFGSGNGSGPGSGGSGSGSGADGPGNGSGSGGPTGAAPCPYAGWPLVAEDGTVYACTRQSLVRSAAPGHLVLGHAARDSWTTLRDRALGDPLLRSVRTLGPLATRARAGGDDGCADGCTACVALGPRDARAAAAWDASPSGDRLRAAVGRLTTEGPPRRLATARGAMARYAALTELGWAGV